MADTIHLSRLLSAPVFSSDGQPVGRLIDATVVLSKAMPTIRRLVLGGRRRPLYVAFWSSVESWAPAGIRLTVDMSEIDAHCLTRRARLDEIALTEDELLLGRDILDSQVFDLSNRRLARVSDVLIADVGSGLAVTAVDLGMGALLRRLGLVRLGGHMQPKLVAWHDLHLASGLGHSVQLATSTNRLRQLDSLALADLVARLGTAPAVELLRAVGPSRSVDALDMSHDIHRRRILRSMPKGEADRITEEAAAVLAQSLMALSRERGPDGRRFRRTSGWRLYRPSARRP